MEYKIIIMEMGILYTFEDLCMTFLYKVSFVFELRYK